MSNHDREGSRSPTRDAELERAWREASAEQPPSHVDAAIIAAARRAAPDRVEQPNAAPRFQSRNRLTAWHPLAAAAGVAGMAFVLVQMLPREQEFAPSTQRNESGEISPSTEPHPRKSARGTTDNGQAPSVPRVLDTRDLAAVPDRLPAQSAIPAPPSTSASSATPAEATASDKASTAEAAASDMVSAAEATANDTTQKRSSTAGDTAATVGNATVFSETKRADQPATAAAEIAGRAETMAAPSPRARESDTGDEAPLEAAAWAAKVVALHESGDLSAAEHALRSFRAIYPDADTHLPDSLRDWARTVK